MPTQLSTAGQPRNPVSLRLYKVLSTHYDDEDTRRAIETLSDYFAPPPASTSKVQVKGEEQQKEKENEKASAAALPFVEGTRGESAARARKHLRRDMELKLAEGSRKFLDALGEVDAVCIFSSGLSLKFHSPCLRNYRMCKKMLARCEWPVTMQRRNSH